MGGVVTGVCGTYWARPNEPQSHHQHTQPSADSCHGRSLSSPRAVASAHSVIYRQRKCLKLTVLSDCSTLMRDFKLNKSIKAQPQTPEANGFLTLSVGTSSTDLELL